MCWPLACNSCTDAELWDNRDPYFYTRRANYTDPQLIIVGGCDHRTGAERLQSMSKSFASLLLSDTMWKR